MAGLALIIAAPFVWVGLQPEPAGQTVSTVDAAAAAALTSTPPAASGAPGESAVSPAAGADAGIDTAPNSPPAAASVPAAAPAEPAPPVDPVPPAAVAKPPARIQIPTLGIDAAVVGMGVREDGQMEIPQDVAEVGWYKFGPAPGSAAGSAVLTGHVDDVRQGPGVFDDLGALNPGNPITVVDEAGVSRQFTVLSREQWNKQDVPLDRLFDRGGSPRIVLVTCGGVFDSTALHYDDNIAITAVPSAA